MSEEEMFKTLLRRLGLSPYEASAYSALVRHGPLAATKLGAYIEDIQANFIHVRGRAAGG